MLVTTVLGPPFCRLSAKTCVSPLRVTDKWDKGQKLLVWSDRVISVLG